MSDQDKRNENEEVEGVEPEGGQETDTTSEQENTSTEESAVGSTEEGASSNESTQAPNGPAKRSNGPVLLLSLACLVLLAVVLFQVFSTNDEVVASVNGDEITKEELYNSMVDQAGQQTVNQMITNKLIEQEAEKSGIEVTEQDINNKMEEMKSNFPSEEQFNMMLQQYGMTEEQLKDQLETQIIMEKKFESEIEVTEEEMKSFFESNKQQFGEDASFADHKQQIEDQLTNQQLQQQIQQWIQQARSDADITNKLAEEQQAPAAPTGSQPEGSSESTEGSGSAESETSE